MWSDLGKGLHIEHQQEIKILNHKRQDWKQSQESIPFPKQNLQYPRPSLGDINITCWFFFFKNKQTRQKNTKKTQLHSFHTVSETGILLWEKSDDRLKDYHNAFTKMPNADYTGNLNYGIPYHLLLQEVLHISELFFLSVCDFLS